MANEKEGVSRKREYRIVKREEVKRCYTFGK
jgi:hypothetical protein